MSRGPVVRERIDVLSVQAHSSQVQSYIHCTYQTFSAHLISNFPFKVALLRPVARAFDANGRVVLNNGAKSFIADLKVLWSTVQLWHQPLGFPDSGDLETNYLPVLEAMAGG